MVRAATVLVEPLAVSHSIHDRPPAAFVAGRAGQPLVGVFGAGGAGPEAVLVGRRRVDDAGIMARAAEDEVGAELSARRRKPPARRRRDRPSGR